jgi:hypothetical protein
MNEQFARIRDAISSFLEAETDLLTFDVNERSITASLANHIRQEFPDWNVDVEYNRLGAAVKRLTVTPCLTDDTNAKTIYPDIIVHRRGIRDNLLVIEVKKINNHDFGNDYAKLEALTYGDGDFGYKFGIHLVFDCQNKICSRSEVWTAGQRNAELSAEFSALLMRAKLTPSRSGRTSP